MRAELKPLRCSVVKIVPMALLLLFTSSAFALTAEKLKVKNPRYGSGWASIHWVESQKKILVWGGDSHNPNGNNSVQLFNPKTRTFEVLQKNNGEKWDRGLMKFTDGVVALSNRDNHFSFYVPKRKEYWAFDGSPSGGYVNPDKKDQLTGHFGGVFSLTQNKWTKIAYTPAEFAKDLIADFDKYTYYANAAQIWNEQLDTGVYYAATRAGTAAFYLIEPNKEGPEPYRLVEVAIPQLTPVSYCRNCAVAVGEYVYVYGGTTRTGQIINDFVRFHIPTRKAVKLAPGPKGTAYPLATYDVKRNKIVVYGGSKSNHLFIYDIESDSWSDKTGKTQLPYMHNGSGVYSPITDEHIYRAGNYFDASGRELDWTSAYEVWSLKLDKESAKTAINDDQGAPQFLMVAAANASDTWETRKVPGFLHQMKHARFATGDDGLIYMHSGDFTSMDKNVPRDQSYQQGVYTYDMVKDKWALVYPALTPKGETQPQRPDQMGWTWDSKRKGFWSLPGYQFHDNVMDKNTTIHKAMFFDPKAKRWSVPSGQNQITSFTSQIEIKNAVYDEVTDKVYQMGHDEVRTFDPNTNQFNVMRSPNYCSGGYAAKVDRDIYCLDDQKGDKLYRFNIDMRIASASALPFKAPAEQANILYDECNKQLIVPIFGGYDLQGDYRYTPAQLWVYPFAMNNWEQRKVPSGKPRGREAAFHKPTCSVMVIGGSEPANDKFYVYKP